VIAARPFVDRPVGDAAVADAFASDAAARMGLDPPRRMRIGMNALYECGDVILRVGRPSVAGGEAIALARRLLDLGVVVPRPAVDEVVEGSGLAATCWRRVVAIDQPVDWTAVGGIVRRVHELTPDDVPVGYPLPSPVTFPWWDFDSIRDEVAADLDPGALAGLDTEIERHRDWVVLADTDAVVCHGDVHPGNVLMTVDGPVLLDWDLLCVANPAWDHAMLLTLAERWGGDRAVYPAFATGYGRSYVGDPAACAFAAMRNVAATLMRVRAARSDPAARDEAERRLRFWRGDADAPAWRAQ
jgi:Phosphotransferase enzyme family